MLQIMNTSIGIINLDTIQQTADRIIETSEEKTESSLWLQAEKKLISSYMALIFLTFPKEEWKIETLVALIKASKYEEDDNNSIDYAFYYLEKWIKNSWNDKEKFDDKSINYAFLKGFPIPSEASEIEEIEMAIKLYKEYKATAEINAKQIQTACLKHIAELQAKDKLKEHNFLFSHKFLSLERVIGN